MGFQGTRVTFDKLSGIYSPGETVSGKVCMNALSQGIGIEIGVLGQAGVKWTESVRKYDGFDSNGQNSYRYVQESRRDNETYFNLILCRVGSLFPGQNEIPFSFILPRYIPSSFRGFYGQVEYKIWVRTQVQQPPFQIFAEFLVMAPLDLNRVPRAGLPTIVTDQKVICCLCCASQPITATLKMSRVGFVSGEEIPFEYEINNPSDTAILACTLSLIQDVWYHTQRGRGSNRSHSTSIRILKRRGVPPHQNELWRESIMPQQYLPPTNLGGSYCRMIKVEYKLQLKVDLDASLDNSFELIMPIVIGTIPLVQMVPLQSSTDVSGTNTPRKQ